MKKKKNESLSGFDYPGVNGAPRTYEGLRELTPFRLRLLLTDVGGLKTEEQKRIWHAISTPEERTNHVLRALLEFDRMRAMTREDIVQRVLATASSCGELHEALLRRVRRHDANAHLYMHTIRDLIDLELRLRELATAPLGDLT